MPTRWCVFERGMGRWVATFGRGPSEIRTVQPGCRERATGLEPATSSLGGERPKRRSAPTGPSAQQDGDRPRRTGAPSPCRGDGGRGCDSGAAQRITVAQRPGRSSDAEAAIDSTHGRAGDRSHNPLPALRRGDVGNHADRLLRAVLGVSRLSGAREAEAGRLLCVLLLRDGSLPPKTGIGARTGMD